MSQDKYRRVEWARVGAQEAYVPAAHGGAAKVVPADAIVIERGALPEVAEKRQAEAIIRSVTGSPVLDVEAALRTAQAIVAAAEYLRAHPPVDEAQVDAVTELLVAEEDLIATSDNWHEVARKLVQRGARVEVPDA